ncbi:MAG: polyribonucleotide nucleotidyltransferase [Candidatus Margulisbacteria bacterium GWF2_35_9]|nr:MAG: polyribonucleotide nucleotidyltransferase [Candidatus Margulisbacteria bacterium GWF2_35_9]
MNKKVVKTIVNDVEYSIETGRMARQADGAVLVRSGDTVVFAAVVGLKEAKEGTDFFPLTVNYTEKMYAAGRIPGNFFKREGRSSTEETLISRLIDRPIRPLFPEGFVNEVSITIQVLSYDSNHLPEPLAAIAASAALSISPIPFLGPIAGVIVGMIDGQFVINPSIAQLEKSKLHLSISGTKDAIMMVEAGAELISEEEMLKALEVGHDAIKKLIILQDDLVKIAGKEKWVINIPQLDKSLVQEIENKFKDELKSALYVTGKLDKYQAIDTCKTNVMAYALDKFGEEKFSAQKMDLSKIFSNMESNIVREAILKDKKRSDGRKIDEIRAISCEVDVLPRTHGSALFTRGETQSLGIVTLGAGKDEVLVDGLEEAFKKRFFLHYNFPAFSVNEVNGRPGPGRREIGHGALAERAVSKILPKNDEFPYIIRIVSEIMESNGSSSMASICSASLALMQAGVPIKEPVSGIAMGLIKGPDSYTILTDIAGLEDHLGDMDFKVAGGRNGITALQMDIKINGITFEIIKESLSRAKTARLEILDKMVAVLSSSSKELSDYAPRIETIQIPEDKVGGLIGPGGKNIKAIIERTGVNIDISDGGRVSISAVDKASIDAAKREINGICKDPEKGEIYTGVVKKITNFGLFLEFLPGKEGLLHISKVSDKFLKNLEDAFKVGDELEVKIEEVDARGRISFIRV